MADVRKYPFQRPFELAILARLVTDPALVGKVGAHLDPARMPSADAQLAAAAALGYWRRLGRAPTPVALVQELRNLQESGQRTADDVQTVARALDEALEQAPADSVYVVEQVCGEARKEAMWSALDQGLQLYGQGRLDDIERLVARAGAIGRVDMDVGVDWAGSLAQRTDARKNRPEARRWGTGIVELDDLIRGGLAPGELGVFLAAPGGGKSTALVTVATHVMNLGGTVVYYSFEMSEADLIDRVDSAVTQVPIDQLRKYADHVDGAVQAWLKRSGGALVVKKFPARTTSVRDVRAHLQYLRAERSVCPTMLVFDYADKMASQDSARYEKDHQVVGAVYDEVRNLGEEFGCPTWTASQTNAEGDEAALAGGHHLARSREKWANMDVGVSINRTEAERANEQVRLHLFKCRYAADGQPIGPLRSDYGRGRLVALRRGADD